MINDERRARRGAISDERWDETDRVDQVES